MWFDNFLYPKLLMLASRLCCVIPLAGLFYSPSELFPYLKKGTVYMIYAFFIASALFCRYFCMMRKMYGSVRVFSKTEKNAGLPENFYTFFYTFKYIECSLLAGYYKLLWRLLFFTPPCISAVVLINNIAKKDGMITGIFLTQLMFTLCLFAAGLIFYSTVKKRYSLVPYLFYINPGEPADSIIKSSVLLTKGKLIKISLINAVLKISSLLSIIPPVNDFVNMKRAVFLKKVYES